MMNVSISSSFQTSGSVSRLRFSDVPTSDRCLLTLSGEGSSGPVRSMTGDVVGTADTGVMVRSEEPVVTLQGPMCDEEEAVLD